MIQSHTGDDPDKDWLNDLIEETQTPLGVVYAAVEEAARGLHGTEIRPGLERLVREGLSPERANRLIWRPLRASKRKDAQTLIESISRLEGRMELAHHHYRGNRAENLGSSLAG